MNPTELVEAFESHSASIIDGFFPLKTISFTEFDKPYMTEELKKIRRKRQRIYRKEGKSDTYLELKNTFDSKLKNEAQKYRSKILDQVSQGKMAGSYKALRKLEFTYDDPAPTFILPHHSEQNLSDVQIAENLADYFSAISQEFEPISISKFSHRIKEELERGKTDASKPILDELVLIKSQKFLEIVKCRKILKSTQRCH